MSVLCSVLSIEQQKHSQTVPRIYLFIYSSMYIFKHIMGHTYTMIGEEFYLLGLPNTELAVAFSLEI